MTIPPPVSLSSPEPPPFFRAKDFYVSSDARGRRKSEDTKPFQQEQHGETSTPANITLTEDRGPAPIRRKSLAGGSRTLFPSSSFVSKLKSNAKFKFSSERILSSIIVFSFSIAFFISLSFSPHSKAKHIPSEKDSIQRPTAPRHVFNFSDLFPSHEPLDPSKLYLHIKVLTYDRPRSLLRCLKSLRNAFYDGDTVSLTIFVDHSFKAKQVKTWNSESSDRLSSSHELLLKYVDGFSWSHGSKQVIYKSQNSGIQPQWLEAWWPESLNDFALIVEDDMELSPMYYRYFKKTLLTYYYDSSNFDPQLYGISFQRQYFVPGKNGNPLNYSTGTPFLYQLVGTWGQFLLPYPWKKFRLWYDVCRYNTSRQPYLEGLISNDWFKAKGHALWTPWIIKWAHSANAYNIYLGFPPNLTLSVSHREKGVNYPLTMGPDGTLINGSNSTKPEGLIRFIPTSQMERRDYCCRVVPRGTLLQTRKNWKDWLSSNSFKEKMIALVFVPPDAYDVTRNWLCHLEGLNIQEYALLVVKEDEALDFTSRGHTVYHIPEINQKNISVLSSGIPEWSLPHVQSVYDALSVGYNVIMTNPYSIWYDNPLPYMIKAHTDILGSLKFNSLYDSILFLRPMNRVLLIWKEVMNLWEDNLLALHNSSGVSDRNLMAWRSSEIAKVFLSGEVSIRHPRFADFEARSKLKRNAVPITTTALGVSKQNKIDFLNSSGLWVINDYDFACKSVTCKKAPIYL